MDYLRTLLACLLVICTSYSIADATLFKGEGFGGSVGVSMSMPQQEFANVGERGLGFCLAGMYFPGARYVQGIRMELGGTWYGTDSRKVPEAK